MMAFYDSPFFASAVLVGCICDIAFVAANRIAFRFGAGLNRLRAIVLVLGLNLLIGGLYAAPFLYWWYIHTISPPGFLFIVSTTNLLAVCCALSVVSILVAAVLHRVFWPTLSRPLYAVVRRGLVRQPKVLVVVAVVFLTWAIPAWKTFWELIARF